MPLFTSESAREAGRKGNLARWKPKEQTAIIPAIPGPIAEPALDPLAVDLAGAINETLERLRKSAQPIHRAQLARALRDLRETYHLVTGKPKPGQLKADGQGSRRAAMPRVYPNVYNPPTGNASNTGTTG